MKELIKAAVIWSVIGIGMVAFWCGPWPMSVFLFLVVYFGTHGKIMSY